MTDTSNDMDVLLNSAKTMSEYIAKLWSAEPLDTPAFMGQCKAAIAQAEEREYRVVRTYAYEELDDDAKTRAREWLIRGETLPAYYFTQTCQYVLAKSHGLTGDGPDSLNILWTLSGCQGDGVAFSGDLNMNVLARHNPQVAQVMAEIDNYSQSYFGHGMAFAASVENPGRYSHWNSMVVAIYVERFSCEERESLGEVVAEEIEETIDDLQDDLQDEIQTAIQAASRELEKMGNDEIEYRQSAEYAEESIMDLGYRFTVTGAREVALD